MGLLQEAGEILRSAYNAYSDELDGFRLDGVVDEDYLRDKQVLNNVADGFAGVGLGLGLTLIGLGILNRRYPLKQRAIQVLTGIAVTKLAWERYNQAGLDEQLLNFRRRFPNTEAVFPIEPGLRVGFLELGRELGKRLKPPQQTILLEHHYGGLDVYEHGKEAEVDLERRKITLVAFSQDYLGENTSQLRSVDFRSVRHDPYLKDKLVVVAPR